MRLTGTQSFEHQARLKQFGEKDIIEKFHVIQILRDFFGLHGLTGEVLMIDNESCRMPDILIKRKPITVIELDGLFHQWGEPIAKLEKDVNRDSDYNSIGVKLIIINEEATLGYATDKIIQVLEQNGLVRCR
jgi:hypothetical protein